MSTKTYNNIQNELPWMFFIAGEPHLAPINDDGLLNAGARMGWMPNTNFTQFVIEVYTDLFKWCRVAVIESEKEAMTETKQMERDLQAQHEHSSFCECIWCVEKDRKTVSTADYAQNKIEQEMTNMLKDLPLPITINKEADQQSDEYVWQFMGTSGKAGSFVDATRQALQSYIAVSM